MDRNNGNSHSKIPEGCIHLLSTTTIFEMDLVGKNLMMNGIEAVWFYHGSEENPDGPSTLFVKPDEKDNALSIIASLDLTDFISYNGK